MLADELLGSLFDGQPHLLAAPMAAWLASSRRFTAFVTANQPKIRKKLRSTQEPESLRDLQLELETAYLLLRERSLSVAYEPQLSEGVRSPDFAVTFTTSLVFMVEVTRLRAAEPRTPLSAQDDAPDARSPQAALTAPLLGDRFYNLLCSKFGQLLPQRSNVLVVGVEAPGLAGADVHAALLRLQQRAESNDPAIVQRQGFRDRAEFFRHYYRLSALLLRGASLSAAEPAILWLNPQARIPLPARVCTALTRSHTQK